MTEIELVQPERPVPPIATAAIHGDTIYCTVVPEEADGSILPGDITEQAEKVFANLAALLTSLGSSLERVLHVTVYLPDIADRGGMTEVWERTFAPVYPARATVQVGLAHPDMRIELTVIAARG
ncbi:MAG TPA: RidA family protein [Microbacteriaceae bacterium]|nr:RidA family protein [Microbacteriaceae bacterium]